MEIPNRQHYVWMKYLRSWTTNGKLYCRIEGRIFPVNPRNIAVEKYFYRFKELSEETVDLIQRDLIKTMAPYLRPNAEGWLKGFLQLQLILREGRNHPRMTTEGLEFIDGIEKMFGELIQTMIENPAQKPFDELIQGDRSLFDELERLFPLTVYLGFQYLRTLKMENIVRQKMGHNEDLDVQALWGLMRVIYGYNFGAGLLNTTDTWEVTYLSAPTSSEFITSDQPIINIAQDPNSDIETELYYPLTPNLAILLKPLSANTGIKEIEITKEEISHLNRNMALHSYKQIYAKSRNALEYIE